MVTPPKPVSSAEKLLPVMSLYFFPVIWPFWKLSKLFPVEFEPLVDTIV